MGGRGGLQRRLALQLLVGAAGAAALAVCAQRTEADTHIMIQNPSPECADNATFVDELGYSCSFWADYEGVYGGGRRYIL